MLQTFDFLGDSKMYFLRKLYFLLDVISLYIWNSEPTSLWICSMSSPSPSYARFKTVSSKPVQKLSLFPAYSLDFTPRVRRECKNKCCLASSCYSFWLREQISFVRYFIRIKGNLWMGGQLRYLLDRWTWWRRKGPTIRQLGSRREYIYDRRLGGRAKQHRQRTLRGHVVAHGSLEECRLRHCTHLRLRIPYVHVTKYKCCLYF